MFFVRQDGKTPAVPDTRDVDKSRAVTTIVPKNCHVPVVQKKVNIFDVGVCRQLQWSPTPGDSSAPAVKSEEAGASQEVKQVVPETGLGQKALPRTQTPPPQPARVPAEASASPTPKEPMPPMPSTTVSPAHVDQILKAERWECEFRLC